MVWFDQILWLEGFIVERKEVRFKDLGAHFNGKKEITNQYVCVEIYKHVAETPSDR